MFETDLIVNFKKRKKNYDDAIVNVWQVLHIFNKYIYFFKAMKIKDRVVLFILLLKGYNYGKAACQIDKMEVFAENIDKDTILYVSTCLILHHSYTKKQDKIIYINMCVYFVNKLSINRDTDATIFKYKKRKQTLSIDGSRSYIRCLRKPTT